MWLLENPNLPEVAQPEATGLPLFEVDIPGYSSGAPLFEADVLSGYALPGVQLGVAPASTTVPIPSYSGPSVTLTVADLKRIDVVTSGGTTFQPAIDPANPQPGEYIFDAPTKQLTLYPSADHPLVAGLNVEATGGSAKISPTDQIDPSILGDLYGLPIKGQVQWNLSAEQHPSGSISAECTEDAIALIRQRFRKGTPFKIAGYGFTITNFREIQRNTDDYPAGHYDLEVTLGGHWEAERHQEPVFLRPEVAKGVRSNSIADPDCVFNGTGVQSGTITPRRTKISLQELAAQTGGKFVAYTPSTPRPVPRFGFWDREVPRDTTRDATVNWLEEISQSRRDITGTFLDLNSPDAVQARSFADTRRWIYQVPAIEVDYQGNCDRSSDHIGMAAEYRNAVLQGEFLDSGNVRRDEVLQGSGADSLEPRWKQRQPVRVVVESGDANPSQPPDYSTRLRTLSNAWDASGTTKTWTTVTLEDGFEVKRIEEIWGWEYTAKDIVDGSGQLNGLPGAFWRKVQQKTTVPIIDEDTLYITGSSTTGYARKRFKTESDEELETILYSGSAEDQPYLNLYLYRDFPILAETRYRLHTLRSHYKDAEEQEPQWEEYKRCNRDGSSSRAYRKNPLFVPSYFIKESFEYTNSFLSTPNPDSTSDAPLPDITAGEESWVKTLITILPGKNTLTISQGAQGGTESSKITASFDINNPQEQDLYLERRIESSASGPGFRDLTTRETVETKVGRPSVAQRRPPSLERVQPEEEKTVPLFQGVAKYEYRLTTKGRSLEDPIGETLSFPEAQTLNEALTGARTQLLRNDIQGSVRYDYAIPFNAQILPYDRVQVTVGANQYRTRCTSVSNVIDIQGQLNGLPVISGAFTQIGAGIDRDVVKDLRFTVSKLQKPGTETLNVFIVNRNIELGSFWNGTIRTRRNFNPEDAAA